MNDSQQVIKNVYKESNGFKKGMSFFFELTIGICLIGILLYYLNILPLAYYLTPILLLFLGISAGVGFSLFISWALIETTLEKSINKINENKIKNKN